MGATLIHTDRERQRERERRTDVSKLAGTPDEYVDAPRNEPT